MQIAGQFSRTILGASFFVTRSSSAWTTDPVYRLGWALGQRALPLIAGSTCRQMSSFPSGPPSCSFAVVQFPCLHDNYGYLIHHEATGHTAAIDVPDASRYEQELAQRKWKLTHIFNTHHHRDHTGGNLGLKKEGVVIYGPQSEQIPGRDVGLKGGIDEVEFGSTKAQILDVGGHTKGHIAYYFASDAVVFVGDSLFALGCGRMFEGTPEKFWKTLTGLRSLPDETMVYWYDTLLCFFTIQGSTCLMSISLLAVHTSILWPMPGLRRVSNRAMRNWQRG
jgi:Metallo-beta-lactamase superfamily